jgi:hypothetical protein
MLFRFLNLSLLILLVWAASVAGEEVDSADNQSDSLSSKVGVYNLLGLNQHIGFNGISFFLSFVKQSFAKDTRLPYVHTFGFGFSGDVLTGLSFIHLIPLFQYWSYSEISAGGIIAKQTYRDIGLAFNSVLISPRLTDRKARIFAGVGPSLHFTLNSYYVRDEEVDMAPGEEVPLQHWKTIPDFKNGFGLIGGMELPLTGTISFLLIGTYKRTYRWDELNRIFYSISMGLAI